MTAAAPIPVGGGRLGYTFLGHPYHPLQPSAAIIDIRDIAHSLSHQGRYLGHTVQLYTVAQHAVVLSHLVANASALAALLHDAEEAYVGDVIAPVKDLPALAQFRAAAAAWQATILLRFGLPAQLPDDVDALDRQLRVNELKDLFREPIDAGTGAPLPLLGRPLVAWSSQDAYVRFLARFETLTGRRVEPLSEPGIDRPKA